MKANSLKELKEAKLRVEDFVDWCAGKKGHRLMHEDGERALDDDSLIDEYIGHLIEIGKTDG